jgi:hypothetical protein
LRQHEGHPKNRDGKNYLSVVVPTLKIWRIMYAELHRYVKVFLLHLFTLVTDRCFILIHSLPSLTDGLYRRYAMINGVPGGIEHPEEALEIPKVESAIYDEYERQAKVWKR